MELPVERRLSSYDFSLPRELIAQEPLRERSGSRLLVLERRSGAVAHRRFSDIPDYCEPGDCLVVNRTRVVPARLYGKKETGGSVEVLFIDVRSPAVPGECFRALVRPFVPEGRTIALPGDLIAVVRGKTAHNETLLELSGPPLEGVLAAHGSMPLPPYIKRPPGRGHRLSKVDREQYQTIYSAEEGSIAAPTAGLHFTRELLEKMREKGTVVAEIVLHVGWGTFRPVTSGDVAGHIMLPEHYEIGETAQRAMAEAAAAGKRIIAVGTTTARALESAAAPGEERGKLSASPAPRETSLFVYPGYRFKAVDVLVTNFHQPCSTPLMMACAFAGRGPLLSAYESAIREKYRFFSYGDAMLIL